MDDADKDNIANPEDYSIVVQIFEAGENITGERTDELLFECAIISQELADGASGNIFVKAEATAVRENFSDKEQYQEVLTL